MKIVIAGAGDVGFHLAKLLSNQAQDIVLIDTNKELLDYAQSHLDVITLTGDSTSIKTLRNANTKEADLLISVTSSEQANIITSVLGKKIGAKQTVARIAKDEYLLPSIQKEFKSVGVDNLYSPRNLVSDEIQRLINEFSITDLHEFEHGRLRVVGVTLGPDSPIINNKIASSDCFSTNQNFLAIAIQRGMQTIIPKGNIVLLENDHVFFSTSKDGLESIMNLTGKKKVNIKNIMILGGGAIGLKTAAMLEKKYNVKLIEANKQKCYDCAEQLNKTLIINGEGSDVELLEEEGLADMDAFIAVTGNSDTNIISSLVAKRHNVHKTIALVDNTDYIHLSHNIGVDTLVNTKLITANNIFMHLRKGSVKALKNLPGVDAEVIEYEVVKGSKATKGELRNIGFPKDAVIGGIIRGKQTKLVDGSTQLLPEDKVVIFTLPKALSELEKIFR